MKIATINEVKVEGLEKLLGEKVTVFCAVYIYCGTLVGVNADCIKLQDARIVYETGAFSDKKFKDAQSVAKEWYIQKSLIESFGLLDKE